MKNAVTLAAVAMSIGAALANESGPEQAVLEALLRHVVAEAQSDRTPAKAICVGGYDSDQISIVRARVTADVPIVGDRSACPIQEAGNRERAYVVVFLGRAVRVSDVEYIVRARVYRNPLDAVERQFTLNLKDGRWIITKSAVNWVS